MRGPATIRGHAACTEIRGHARAASDGRIRHGDVHESFDIGELSSQTAALLSQTVAALGARVHLGETLTASAELAGGGRMYSWMEHGEVTSGTSVIEARGQVDWCHFTFGAALGTSLISRDQTFTVGFAAHLRAFDAWLRHVAC